MPRRYKEARQAKKIKLTDAADILGVSQPALSAWEGERKSPTIDNLIRMAEEYEVSTDYLLGVDGGIINLPLVLDGPFSTLSNENTSLVAKKLPEFAEQVIIFMLDKDWSA